MLGDLTASGEALQAQAVRTLGALDVRFADGDLAGATRMREGVARVRIVRYVVANAADGVSGGRNGDGGV